MKRIVIAAVAAALGVGIVAATTEEKAHAFAGEVFEITGAATNHHFEQVTIGKKAFVNKITPKSIAACIAGTNPGDQCSGRIDQDNGGKAYIFFDSTTSWRMSTHSDGSQSSTLTGLIDGAGNFMFAGTHAKSGYQMILTGKVKFAKGTFTPLAISGKMQAVSTLALHFFSGTFKSVGKQLT